MLRSALKTCSCLVISLSCFQSFADVLPPADLLKNGYKSLPTFEAVAIVDHTSGVSKSKTDLEAEDFASLNQDPLFQALARLQFNYEMSAPSQAAVDNSKILQKIETALSKRNLLDLSQENGLTVININVLNNTSGKLDDSKLKASAFVGTTKNFKKEKDLALSINLIIKKDGSVHSPSEAEITAALLALLTK